MLAINSSKTEVMSEIAGQIVLAAIGIINLLFVVLFVFFLRLEIMKNERASPETGLLIKILAWVLCVKLKEAVPVGSKKMTCSLDLPSNPTKEDKGNKREENGLPVSSVGNFSF